jgi:hypothetical protein
MKKTNIIIIIIINGLFTLVFYSFSWCKNILPLLLITRKRKKDTSFLKIAPNS